MNEKDNAKIKLRKLIRLTKNCIRHFRMQDFFHSQRLLTILISYISGFEPALLNRFTGGLREIINAQENNDAILIADLLEIHILSEAGAMLQELILNEAQTEGSEADSIFDIALNKTLQDNLSLIKDARLTNAVKQILAKPAALPEKYSVEPTNLGTMTLRYNDGKACYYYHSNTDPYCEGEYFAEYYTASICYSYTVLGFGFGYHIRSLLNLDRRFYIRAVETDANALALALAYCDLTDILSSRQFSLVYCPENELGNILGKLITVNESPENPDKKAPQAALANSAKPNLWLNGEISYIKKAEKESLEKAAEKNSKTVNSKINAENGSSRLIIHFPSLRHLSEGPLKSALNNFFINTNTMYAQKKYLDWNYYYNIKLNDLPADRVFSEFKGKEIIYVGGGPSLEGCMDWLKEQCQNKDTLITCASTVFKKLTENEIEPDYIFMIDPADHMLSHIKGAVYKKSSLLYLCTASMKAVHAFEGKRYIFFQHGYQPAEEYASQNNLYLTKTGGSVSTAAIDIIISHGAARLITLGMDLAHTDNKPHSFTSGQGSLSDNGSMLMVKSVSGGLVPTTNVLNLYRLWIEKRIENNAGTELINISRGAVIKGMKNLTSPHSL